MFAYNKEVIFKKYFFIWLHQALVAAWSILIASCGIFPCGAGLCSHGAGSGMYRLH